MPIGDPGDFFHGDPIKVAEDVAVKRVRMTNTGVTVEGTCTKRWASREEELLAVRIELEGMVAMNMQRAALGESMVYDDAAFHALAVEHGLAPQEEGDE